MTRRMGEGRGSGTRRHVWGHRARRLGLGTLGALLLALLLMGSTTRALAAQGVVATIPVGTSPEGVAVNPTANRAYALGPPLRPARSAHQAAHCCWARTCVLVAHQ